MMHLLSRASESYRHAVMLSLDEPLDLKVSSSRDRTHRTSICAPLRFARTRIPRPTRSPDTDISDSPTSSKPDLSACPSSSPPSPQHSSSSCGPLSPPQARDSETLGYLEGEASPPPRPPGFQFFLPIGAGGSLLPPGSILSTRRQNRRDSPEPVEEQLACRWLRCHLLFECLQDLVDHVTESHVKPERSSGYCCHWEGCARKGRGFNARYKMLIHIRTHTNEKPHQCPICSKSFSRLENLKIHTRSHTGEKPYACPYEGCGKRYSNSSDRFKHTRTHYEDRPYCCKMAGCPKRYTDPSSLRKHIKAHGHSVSSGPEPAADPPTPPASAPRAHLVLPGAALALLHAFTGPLMALGASPLDLSMSAGHAGADAVLCHNGMAPGLGKAPLFDPLLLPSFGLEAKQRILKEKAAAADDDDDENENREAEEGRNSFSWVFVPPGMMMLKQAIVS